MRDTFSFKRTIFAYYADLEDAQAELEIMKSQDDDDEQQQGTNVKSTEEISETQHHQKNNKGGLNAFHNLIDAFTSGCGDANRTDEDDAAALHRTDHGLVPPSPPVSPRRNVVDKKQAKGSPDFHNDNADVMPSQRSTESIESEFRIADLSEVVSVERRQIDSNTKRAASADDERSTAGSVELRLRPLEQRSVTAAHRPPLSPYPPSASKEYRGAATELHRRARSGEWQKLRNVLTATAASDYSSTVSSASQPDEKGRTPLMLACRHGASFPADVARLLLVSNNNAASKVAKQPHGGEQTCLHIAATAGCSLEVLDVLLAGAPSSIYMVDDDGNMPLHLAVNNGIYRCAAVEDDGAFGTAMPTSEGAVVLENMPPQDVLVQKKRHASACHAEIMYDDVINADSSCDSSIGEDSSTFLASANAGFESHTDLVDACDLLIMAHPEALRHRNRRGETPLLLAMYRRASADVLSLLLRKGGSHSVQISDNFGSYPLHFCDRAPSLRIIRDMARLYPEGTMSLNELQETPLYSAMLDNCDASVLRVLLDACPEPEMAVNKRNVRGESVIKFGWDALLTPRIVAAEDQDEEDARIEDSKRLLQSASSVEGIKDTPLGKWWEKAKLLLMASYHNSTALDEKTGFIGERVWSPCHAAASVACPLDMLKFVLQIHPFEVTSTDEHGNTPYHIIALHSATIPKDFMYAIINAGPPDAALLQNNDGNTPLHFAILSGAPPDMLQIMLATGSKAACIKNEAGLTPIFMSLANGTPTTTLRMILKACPESVHVRDHHGTSSIQFAWNLLIAGMIADNTTESKDDQEQRSASNINALALSARSSSLVGDPRAWMGKIDLLLRTAFHGVAENRSIPHRRRWRAVHAACNGGTCPFDVLAFSLQILPMEIQVVNEDGNLPLHIAASAPPYETNKPAELASGRPIHLLLNRFPAGSKKLSRKGRLPLHLALASGKTLDNGIDALVDSFPESVRMRDPETMLFPFMLAAAKRQVDDDSDAPAQDREDAELASLNNIFTLLLEAPELVLKKNGEAELHYAKRRNMELLAEMEHLRQQHAEVEEELRMRMTRLEIKEMEDIKKMEETRKREEECRARAAYLEQNCEEVLPQLAELTAQMEQMKSSYTT